MLHRATIERATSTSDTGGGYTKAWSTVETDVPCRAWSVSATEVVASGRPESINTRLVIVPRNTDVKVGDRLGSITDRQNRLLFTGPLMVDAINEKPDHLQLTSQLTT